jgi:AAA15 family ATPase/GTPase
MNNIIKKVDISGFRSIESETIKCGIVNVFCGANDSGKSNVLRALNLFFNNQTDFVTSLKFSDDYNKVAFAKAVRATKMKQQIKIRVYINPPATYGSLKSEKEVFIERAYDRNGAMTEKYSNDKKKGTISRLFNKIKYIYIPALKGRDVLQYILGLIGGYELIDQEDIISLNNKITNKTKDLTEILNASNITIDTSFGLPTLLSDFWEKLSVDTTFEKTSYIDENIKGTGDRRDLNLSLFKIPLTSRGEGIKSKYIPPLLEWLNLNDSDNTYVWGIDEPENSLEFSLCEDLSHLYYNEYAKNIQSFLTTHSLAFMNPAESTTIYPKIFRCKKDEFGSTKCFLLEDLFKDVDKLNLFDELGVLNVQKELIEQFRKYNAEKAQLQSQIKDLESKLNDIIGQIKCVVLTEDSDISLLKSVLGSSGFNMSETDLRTYEGCTNIIATKVLSKFIKEKFPDLKILIHLDRDYKTDAEVGKLIADFNLIGVSSFFTQGTDIESHFVLAEHINKVHPDISTLKATELITEVNESLFEEAIKMLRLKNFGDKHKQKSSHADLFIDGLPRTDPRKYVKGKSAYNLLKQKIKDTTIDKINSKLHESSEYLADPILKEISKQIWT